MADMTNASVYDALPIGVCVIDGDLQVHEWNACLTTWTGVPRHEILGRGLLDFFPDFDEARLASRLRTVFEEGGRPLVLSAALHQRFLPIRMHDGGLMPQRTHIRRMTGCDSSKALVSIEDLTHSYTQLEVLRRERRRLRESETTLKNRGDELEEANAALADARDRAEHANRSKSEFLANMSHEIRTPLTAILGYADILLDAPEPEMLQDAAGTIRRNGDHLLAIVNDILDLSKIEAGRMQIDHAPCDPVHVAEEVISLMRVRAESKNLTLRLTTLGEPGSVESDAIRLRQILLNLVGNAIKFTKQGSVELAATWRPEQSLLRFDVTDTGIGVADDQLEAIFQPFNQADTSARRRFGGTGLGLTICRRLAEMLGGEVQATSKLGEGSTFSVVLPVQATNDNTAPAAQQALEHEATDAGKPDGPPLAGRQILVAEDGIDNQRLVRYLLEKVGASVTIVGDGEQAVGCLLGEEAQRFDVVLMDMQMPIMDGYQATRTLRDRGYDGPVIALTAHAMDGDRQKTLDAGCDDYSAKPFNPPQLVAMIQRYCDAGRAATAL